jgi:hypothetical protein
MRTQFNVRLPETHVERLDAMRQARGGLSQSEMMMSLIDTEWGRRQARGEKRGPLHILPDERMTALVADMNRYALDGLEAAVLARRLEIAAGELRARGIPVLTRVPDSARGFGYLMVLAPNYLSAFSEEERRTIPPNVLADAAEARHLLDYLRELPPVEAYRRWHRTVAPLSEELAAKWWYTSYMDYHSAYAALERLRSEMIRVYYSEEPTAAELEREPTFLNEEMALSDMLRDVAGALKQ